MKFFIPFLFILCLFVLSCDIPKDKNLKKVEQGKASKITYEDHTYIVWSINLGGGIVHDPNCKCTEKL